MFAPTLFIGAMLGAAVGGAEHALFPHLDASSGTYALVGMGVLFAGFLRAPMTSVFMVLEVSGDYSIIVPVIVANTFAYVISRAFQPSPIFDVLSRQDGVDLPSMEELREEDTLQVEDAMQPAKDPVLDVEDTVSKALAQSGELTSDHLLVRVKPSGWNVISKQELQTMANEGKAELTLRSVLPIRQVTFLHPDHPLEMALRYLHQWPLVPVVSRANYQKLEGVISQKNVLERYRAVSEM
jgi:CIC family chloride channel protein